ncbi:MAG TPA: GEVED domain-containing protein, partial [Bacteroidales bacterium]|nr:GEVED domain-containing protein [Bacteroidales bacterium]
MKKGLLLLVSVLFSLSLSAQVVVLFEDFEVPTLGNLVTSTTAAGGAPHWAISDRLATSGINSDTCKVPGASTSYLTTNFFNTIGNTYVLLEFNQICKINFFDIAEIQVTGDSGQTWTTLTGSQYLGTGAFASLGNKFGPSSYGVLWEPSVASGRPTNAWFKSEQFNVSTVCGNKTNAAVRFKLSDGGSPSNPEYGWILDDIRVTAALSELTPPAIASFTPNLTGNVFNTGPFNFTASVSDPSGVMSVFMPYSINGNKDTIFMVNTSGNNYQGAIPAVTHLDVVCYKLVAIDNSLSHNVAYLPDSTNFYCFTASTEEAALLGIDSPVTGCGLGMEAVTIRIKNTGLTTIAGDLWAKYWIVGTTDTVTEYITTPIVVNQILTYTFDSLVNVDAPAGDITYALRSEIKLLGDPVASNNTQVKNFISGFVPPKAPVMYDTINYATSTTLNTTITGATIKWFADSLGLQLLSTGNSFTTPILFSDTMYYRNGTSGFLQCSSDPSPYFIEVGDKPPYDAAVIKMMQPVSAINMIAQEKVKIRIQNFGGDTIWNFPVRYSINGGTPVSETYADTLMPNDSADFQFNTLADLSTPGSYLFKTWVALPGDTTYLNDTITKLVVHSVPNYCQSYAINAASGSDIGNVTFSNLNNGTSTPQNNNVNAINGYTDFTSSVPSVQLAIGLNFPITVKRIVKGTTAPQAIVKVFIDYDRSGTYEETTETVLNMPMGYNAYQVSNSVTIPQWVNPGVAQMRVVLQETSNQHLVHACGYYTLGETEDYTVVLYPQIPFDGG